MKSIIEDFMLQGGSHCITNALKQVFTYYGYPLSEAMMFGLASGLSFLYLNASTSPMVSGRIKVFAFEEKLAERLHIKIHCKSGKNYSTIVKKTKHLIDTQNPVLIYVDMAYLKYLGMSENNHFGGHAVVLFGYDDIKKQFYISDRDNHDVSIRTPHGEVANDFHCVAYDEIQLARSSTFRPFPALNKYLIFDFRGYQNITKLTLQAAIQETCMSMLHPPAQLIGINGILKFSKEIKKWKKFDIQKLQLAGITNYFQIHGDGGTGGGAFRKMYGEFLKEASPILGDDRFREAGNTCIALSLLWDDVAKDLWQLSQDGDVTLLDHMSIAISNIYDVEKKLYSHLLNLIS